MCGKRPNGLISKIFLALLALSAGSGTALAATVDLPGISFMEASENVRLLTVTGTGTLADPFVMLEEITDDGDAVVEIDVHSVLFGSRVATFHRVGFALTKVVVNRTHETWRFFNIELEPHIGSGSDYYDGLSFGQEATVNRPFTSDRFRDVEDIQEPRDILRFRDGEVAPGERVSFHFAITHTGPTPHFYLVQHVRRPVSDLARPLNLATAVDQFSEIP